MTAETSNAKQVYFEAYSHLSLLENVLKNIKEEDLANFQISIVGKVSKFYLDKDMAVPKDTEAIKLYWEKTFNSSIAYGSLNNPQFENIFIVGTLASSFLYDIDGKPLGMLSAGPYGILRGIGGCEIQVTAYLKMHEKNYYLLIFIGSEADLENYKRLLGEI